MRKLISLFRQWAGKKPPMFDLREPDYHRLSALSEDKSATVLEFQPARRWPPEALDRLAEDLAAARPAQTNAHIIKFPRYRRQYKPEWRPVTRRGS